DPAWSPDGSWIAYRAGTWDRARGLYVVRPDGKGRTQLSAREIDGTTPITWSPDGTRVAFTTCLPTCEVRTVGLDGTGDQVIGAAIGPAWSPDGSRLAWLRDGTYVVADAEGRNELVFRHNSNIPMQGGIYDGDAPVARHRHGHGLAAG